jgi:Ca2+-binding EF-hand superfamily protein
VFRKLDSGNGILSLKDFSVGLSKHFNITLKREELTMLFKEVDEDRDGLVKFKELEVFINKNYNKILSNIEKQKGEVSI